VTAELVLRVQLDPAQPSEVDVFADVAGRPVVSVKHLDVNVHQVGGAVLNLLRAAAHDHGDAS
jgi:hypothetical protein